MLGGRILFEQLTETLVRLPGEQRLRASLAAVVEGGETLRRNRETTAYTVVREQNRTREISVGERPSEASSAMCILSLLLGRLSRFISMMSPLRSWGVMVIFSMCGRFFGGWMDVASLPCHKGRPFVQLSCPSSRTLSLTALRTPERTQQTNFVERRKTEGQLLRIRLLRGWVNSCLSPEGVDLLLVIVGLSTSAQRHTSLTDGSNDLRKQSQFPRRKQGELRMSAIPSVTLKNDVAMPLLGFGVFQTPPDVTTAAVEEALRLGYRHIDTAAAYGNEREVGEGVRRSGIARDEVFLETKVWISDYGYDATLHAFDKSAGKLGVDRLDLLILHQPLSSRFDLTLDAYRALEKLMADGKVRAIGVSNFMPEHLERLLTETSVVPAVNQIELHPYFQQTSAAACARRARHPDPGLVAHRRHHLLRGRREERIRRPDAA